MKFHKYLSCGSTSFCADRPTDMTKLTIAVHNLSANAPKKLLVTKYIITLHTEPTT